MNMSALRICPGRRRRCCWRGGRGSPPPGPAPPAGVSADGLTEKGEPYTTEGLSSSPYPVCEHPFGKLIFGNISSN